MLTWIYNNKFYIFLTLCVIVGLASVNIFATLFFNLNTEYGFFINLLVLLIPILMVHMFGMFDGAQTVRKDCPDVSVFWKVKEDWNKFPRDNSYWTEAEKWFMGGNDKYPPGHPYKGDFWHFCKWMWTLCISASVMMAMMAILILPYEWKYFTLIYLFAYGIEGFSFTFYYSYIFRKDRDWNWYWNHIKQGEWKIQK